MSDKPKKTDKDESLNLNQSIQAKVESSKNKENQNILIGNKRERPKEEEEEQQQNDNKKSCGICTQLISSDSLDLNEPNQNEAILDIISKQIKDEKFLKILKENIDKILNNKESNNENTNKDIICYNCLMDNFIVGGLEKIFSKPKNEINFPNFLEGDEKNNLKLIVDIYSVNLNLAIKSLKDLKEKYSKIIDITNELFKNIGIKNMLSYNKEAFPDLKKKMDNCKQNLVEIEENFINLINNLSSKEMLKKFYIEGVFSNDNSYKNNLLKVLKQVENEIEFSTFNINGIPQILNSENDKNFGMFDTTACYNLDKIKNDKEVNDKNNINNINKNNLINNQIPFNLQNQKKQNINEQILLNNIDKNEILKNNLFLSQNNLIPINPLEQLIGPGLGLFPNLGLSQGGRISNNILLNNISPSPIINPQLLSQINNSQINSIIPNNNNSNTNLNSNENSKNINLNNLNNIGNLPLTNINGYIQRHNLYFNNLNDPLKEIENIYSISNIISNNNQNNLVNNLYGSNINSNPLFGFNTPSPLLLPSLSTNLRPPSSPLYNNLLNIQTNNSIPNLSQPQPISNNNNSNIDQNKTNQINNLINNERNLINVNNANNKGPNINNLNNMNTLNLNNLNSTTNLNNLNGINNINNLNGLNCLPNNYNRNDINNNLNNLFLYQGQHQQPQQHPQQQPQQQLEQQQPLNNQNGSQKNIVDLFDCVKKQNDSNYYENNQNLKNNNINNNNPQEKINVNTNNEQNNLKQINITHTNISPAPINIVENNTNSNNKTNINNNNINLKNLENNNALLSNNINKNNDGNIVVNNGNEQLKKDN